MKAERDIKRRYQHPDAVSYTPENEDGLMLLIKPSFSFANIRASALSLRLRMFFVRFFPTYKNVCWEKVYTDVQLLNRLFAKGLRHLQRPAATLY